MEDQECSRGSRLGTDEKSGLLCLSSAQGLYLGTWCTVLSLHFEPVTSFVYFKCDIQCHLSRTYGRAISVTRLAGAPIKMTIARFAMKNCLFCAISSGWQPEKLRLGEEVVHSKPWSDVKFSWPLKLNILMVILQIEKLQHHPRILFDKDWQSAEQKCPTMVMVAFPGCATAEATGNLFHTVYTMLEACENWSNWWVELRSPYLPLNCKIYTLF